MYIANCPFNKIKILGKAMIGFEKSFQMMYSNLCLNSRETVPLNHLLSSQKSYTFHLNTKLPMNLHTMYLHSNPLIPRVIKKR